MRCSAAAAATGPRPIVDPRLIDGQLAPSAKSVYARRGDTRAISTAIQLVAKLAPAAMKGSAAIPVSAAPTTRFTIEPVAQR
jgi:hypothetical protein